jgi:hypothetical protein
MTRTPQDPYAVSAGAVLVLQSMTSYPSVSLLMTTRPGRLDDDHAARLHALRDSVARRLAQEDVLSADRMLAELDRLIASAGDAVLDRGLALYVSEHHAQLFVLPVEVVERAVVDPTFATRDLVRALHRTPRHAVLVLSAQEARLFDGQLGHLAPADTTRFPMQAHRHERGREPVERFLRRVDQGLGAYLRLRPTPIVLLAAEPTLSQFAHASTNLTRLAGKVVGNHITTPLPDIAALVAPRIEQYLASREDEALALLERRRGQDRAVLGLESVWMASRWERPEMLAVEVDFFYPARISADGDTLQPADDVEHPDVVDDVIDELVEQVLARGAWVALVEPGHIPDGHRIALTTRQR